jgi:tetratricopeptide (TPR) repeat protein
MSAFALFRPASGHARSAFLVLGAVLALSPAACAQSGAVPAGSDRPGLLAAATDGDAPADAGARGSGATPVEAGDGDRPSGVALGKYLAGRTAQYANDIGAAADSFAAALEADPGNTMLMRRAYYYLLADGRFDEAVAVARRAVEAIPDEDFAPLVLATAAIRDGDAAAARDLLAPLEPSGLNGLLQPLMAGWAALVDGDLDAALAALEPARDMTSARRLVDLHAALMAHVGGDDAQAMARIDAYLDEAPPDNARPLELVTMLLVHNGRLEQAREIMRTYMAQGPAPLVVTDLARRLEANEAAGMPDLVRSPTDGFAEALYHVGLVVNQGQGSDTAIALIRMALAVRPDFPRAALAIAETLRRMERYEAATAVLQGIDTGGDSALDYVVRLYTAENLENLDRIDEALARYDALAAAHPDQIEPLVDKGDLLRRDERFAEAAQAFGAALDRIESGAGDSAMLWPVLFRRGVANERAGNWDQAEADFKRALDLEPGQPEILNYLGYSWLDRGEHIEEAVEMIREAVRQRPNDGYIVDSLGWGYYLLGRYEEAVIELERAVELRPQDWTINDHLGDAYWRVGRRTEARFQWERALSLDPEDDVIDDIERKLKQGLDPAGQAGQ